MVIKTLSTKNYVNLRYYIDIGIKVFFKSFCISFESFKQSIVPKLVNRLMFGRQ